ncbi:histone demethylase [Achlya hypogyna]|uniref:[histone H3]-trimethyl-L-lysine(4) demethylase n=1 Tax=Achlya hypogyna TaxID=1202772 RepID=A0A1V9ZBL1_ACHHY|nr:histone demethylase [Achlya hypogyna]
MSDALPLDADGISQETHGYVCPPCLIFYPTAAEFENPLQYIASIRDEARKTGICKIVPPKGWRPPFAVNEKKFRFRTRLQPLHCIEGNAREEGRFLEALRMFLYRRGTPMQDPPAIDGKLVPLHLLYRSVVQLGGVVAVDSADLWTDVVGNVNALSNLRVPLEALDVVRQVYYKYLAAYEEHDKSTMPADTKSAPATPLHTPQQTPVQTPVRDAASTPSTHDEESSPQAVMKKRGRGRPRKGEETPESTSSATASGIFPGLIKRGRGRPRKNQGTARILMPDEQEPVAPELLEASGLTADPARTSRLPPPVVRLHQKFYRAFNSTEPLLGEVKRVLGGKKPSVAIEYADGAKDTVPYATMQFILANGSDPTAAKQALAQEICQYCLRGDCRDKMLLCDGCNGGYHTFCLATPLAAVPDGDWFCDACMGDKDGPGAAKFGFEMGAEYTLAAFKAKADAWLAEHFAGHTPTPLELETEYWRLLNSPHHKMEVEYGSDVDTGALGSGFPVLDKLKKLRTRLVERWKAVHLTSREHDPTDVALQRLLAEGLQMTSETDFDALNELEMYARSPWNLTNLPKLHGSLLQYLDEDIKGVMVPWLYVGMAFSTFCWHVEDHNFYSISYLHRGAPKTWYGVPGHAAGKMEAVMRTLTPELFVHQPDLHLQLVTMFSPETLRKHGVPVYRATHEPNEFIVTFPSSYHGGFNNGFNLAEAVNFATPDWLPWGHSAVQNYKRFGKVPVFSHDALLCTLTLAAIEHTHTMEYPGFVSQLLPCLQQLHQEALAFESAAAGLPKTEDMTTYLASHGRANSTTRNSARMRDAKSDDVGDDDDCEPPTKMHKSGKMMAAGKMVATKMMAGNSRMSRMVLWAGRSGKNEGLRCSKCQQYCYLQAVVCLRCRSVGCADHFATMCKCDSGQHGCFLYRMQPSQLLEYIHAIETKVTELSSWEMQAKTYSTAKGLEEVVKAGEGLLAQGLWVPVDVLQPLQRLLKQFKAWRARASPLLDKVRKAPTTTMKELQALIGEAAAMAFVIPELERLKALQQEVEVKQVSAQGIMQQIVCLKMQQGRPLEEVAQDWVAMLKEEAGPLSQLVETIQAALDNLNLLGVLVPERSLLMSDLAYVNWLLAANTLLTRSTTNVHNEPPADWAVFEMFPSITDLNALWSSPARNLVHQGWKLDKLSELRALCESERLKLSLEEKVHAVVSLEELEEMAKRLIQLPAVPLEAVQLLQRLKDGKQWEATVSTRLDEKIPLPDALQLEAQAEACGIPASSLLRRQLHNRVQDAKRWQVRAFSLFKHAMASETDMFCLQNIVDRADVGDDEFGSLVCVCQHVYSAKVPLLRCSGCCRLYHPACVGVPSDRPAKATYLCQECCHARRKMYGYRSAPPGPLYCLCREAVDNVPMICCDFCDEWFHAKCIGISPTVMSTLEAYRCPGCALRQGVPSKRKGRPSPKQIMGLIARGESLSVDLPALDDLKALVVRGTDLHAAVVSFEAHFFSTFSIRTILSRLPDVMAALDAQREEVRRYEALVTLDAAHKKLRAIHWCVRACQLTLGNQTTPRYSQLVILVADAKQDKLDFPNEEMRRFYGEIEANVSRAVAWVESVKRLHLDPTAQTYPHLMALRTTAEEISQYLVLPDTAVTNFNVALKFHARD